MKRGLNQRGFSVVEVIIGIAILIVGVLPVMSLLVSTNRNQVQFDAEVTSAMAAQDLLAVIRQLKWDENSGNPPAFTASRSSIGLDGGEAAAADFDDIDDYHAYSDSFDSKFRRVVQVNYVNVVLNGAVTAAGGPTDYKLVRVTVNWNTPAGPAGETTDVLLVNGVTQ